MIDNKLILQFIAAIYIVFLISRILPINKLGIVPRKLKGLFGIAVAPFLHNSWKHILSNTIPLTALLLTLNYFYPEKTIDAVLIIVLLGGLFIWLLGRKAIHIGASGVIYGLAAFIITHGFLVFKPIPLLVSIFVIVIYGGLIWGMLPSVRKNTSWEGHLFGAIAGVIAAYFIINYR